MKNNNIIIDDEDVNFSFLFRFTSFSPIQKIPKNTTTTTQNVQRRVKHIILLFRNPSHRHRASLFLRLALIHFHLIRRTVNIFTSISSDRVIGRLTKTYKKI